MGGNVKTSSHILHAHMTTHKRRGATSNRIQTYTVYLRWHMEMNGIHGSWVSIHTPDFAVVGFKALEFVGFNETWYIPIYFINIVNVRY